MAQCWRKNPIENRIVTAAQIVAYNSARLSVLKARTYQTGPRAGQALAERARLVVLARELGLREVTKPVRFA
jgi:hypothetical protein